MKTSLKSLISMWSLIFSGCATNAAKGEEINTAEKIENLLGFMTACEVRSPDNYFSSGIRFVLFYPLGGTESTLFLLFNNDIDPIAWYHYPFVDHEEFFEAEGGVASHEAASRAFNFLSNNPYTYVRDYKLSNIFDMQLTQCEL